MPRNYEGERLCRQWLIDSFQDCYECNREYLTEDEQKKYNGNIMLYWKDIFNAEHNYENCKRKCPNLQDRIEDYYRDAPALMPIIWHEEMLELRDKWGYTTKDDKWINNFLKVLAFRTLQLLDKYKVDYSDLY